MKKWMLLLSVMFSILAGACSKTPDCAEKLNGRWHNELMTVSYDFGSGKTIITALGGDETKPLAMKSCSAEMAVFMSGDVEVIAKFIDESHISLSSPGKIPLEMVRLP